MDAVADLSRRSRLTRPNQFKQAFANGRRVHQPPFTLVFRLNTLGHARFGMAIGKRYAKRAVERNRLKRQLREAFRSHCDELPAVDCVFYLNSVSAGHSNAMLRSAIDRLWQKMKAKCERS